MDSHQQPSDNASHSESSHEDIMLRPRKKNTFTVEDVVKARVKLYGAQSPVHTKPSLRDMFKDTPLETKLEMQKG